ncbi:MAG: glutamate synthase subunit alpha, partial [Beijerinckiaceae bacterium]|nr:glutamate synthase subunit alpha [Beijerinckiaceae bacterium]
MMSDPTRSPIMPFDAAFPAAQGLYDPANESDACGVGFVADMKNRKSHDIVAKGLEILLNLDHRGAVGADPKAGDGCGMLIQVPDRFLREETAKAGFTLPGAGDYAVGALFLPRDPEGRRIVEEIVEKVVAAEGQVFLGWRDVPVDPSGLGESVKPTEPVHKQIFIGRGASAVDQDTFERKLFVLRKVISNTVYNLNDARTKGFYPVSLSSRTLVYKGMLLATQLGDYFLDLRDPRLESALSLVHQRFSTNTVPTWSLAHPYRMVAHNGEI